MDSTLHCPSAETMVDIEKAWEKYFADRSNVEIRNALVEYYLPLVYRQAKSVSATIAGRVELEDLVSVGTMGLIRAISKFDPNRGVRFETYCQYRIRGAMKDGLRNNDWIPRQTRTKSRFLAEATKSLSDHFGRLPTDEELAAHLNISTKQLRELVTDALTVKLVSLDSKYFTSDSSGEMTGIELLADRHSKDPADIFLKDDIARMVTRGLTQKERNVILLYYYEGMTLKEIGLTLDLSEGRVSQIHADIIRRLRRRLKERRHDIAP
ncbi:MAG: FliA/WhiG family RNA polymerase sigma factor [Thermoguttaceae bacterium]|nr:FliA/WhiG family RNA polymerase sigma factor [Thermoguttaceae bacterium]